MFDICIVIRCSMWLNYKKGGNVEFVVFTFFLCNCKRHLSADKKIAAFCVGVKSVG